jgi:4-amino-4-deoxy-L-arabinose transferase-like glycosyltransferase
MRLPVPRWVLVALAVAALAAGIDNLTRPLANPDEGRYSEISREMAASGDWVTPRLNGIKYFEKPPLQYWATAAAFKAFGTNEAAARLYVGLCGLLGVLLVAYTALRLWDPDTALAAALVLASSPYFMALGGIVTLDMGLTLWTTATLCALLIAERTRDRPREHRGWMLASWAAMALAVLSKGLVGIVFPGAALFLYCVLRRDLSIVRRLEWLYGLPLFFAIAAPWFIAVSMANPEFARFFFIHEHFERFLTQEHRRVAAWWYFLPILALGFLPWMFALPASIARAWREEGASPAFQPMRLVLLWSAFIVLFFSASSSKLPAYILPAFPPLALAIGRYLATAPARSLAAWPALVAPIALVLAWQAWRVSDVARDDWTQALYLEAQVWALAGAVVLFVASVAGAALLWRGRRWAALVVVAFASVALVDCLENAYEELSPRQSGQIVADRMKRLLTPATRVYSVKFYDQTVPFYIGRTLTLVDYLDEFETGLASEPERHIADLDHFREAWVRPGDALAIMHPDAFQRLQSQGLPMQVLHDDPRRVLVRKP